MNYKVVRVLLGLLYTLLAAIAALYVIMSAGRSVSDRTTSFKKFEFVIKYYYKINTVHRSILGH